MIPIIVMIPKDVTSDHRALDHIPYSYLSFLDKNALIDPDLAKKTLIINRGRSSAESE